MRHSLAPIALAALAFAWGAPARAQSEPPLRPLTPFTVGGSAILAQPVGPLGDQIGVGGGLDGYVSYHPIPLLGLRADAGFIVYGSQNQRACFSSTVGCRVEVNVNTTYGIAYGELGPELVLPAMGPLHLYGHAGVGFAYFSTGSSVGGVDGGDFGGSGLFHTDNFHDATLAWVGGGGARVPFAVKRVPVALDLGVAYHANGTAEYLRKDGGIEDRPDGSIILHPTRSEANFLTYRLGVTVTIPRGR